MLLSLIHSKRTGHSRHSDTGIYNVKTVTLVSFVIRIILLASAILENIATPIRRGSAATRLLGLRVRIPRGAWMFVSCECCVSSGRGLCDRPADHSSRGVLPSVVLTSVIFSLNKEETLAH